MNSLTKTQQLFICLLFVQSLFAQNYSNNLGSTTWYCNCNFNTDSLKLVSSNSANYRYRLNFSPDGKVLLFDLSKKTSNTFYSYTLRKSTLKLFYTTKDSLAELNYLIQRNKKTNEFDLGLYYNMRYKKRKASDTPPVNTFTLSRGKKTKSFESMQEITVYRMKKGLKHDSIEVISKGHFLEIRSDTLILNAYQYSEHNFYKNYPDTNHFFSETLFDTLIRIKSPIKEITKIYSQREEFNRGVNIAAITALGVFFVTFPLAITVESSTAGAALGQTAVFAAASIPVIVSLNMLFSKQKFQIIPDEKKKETWRLDYKK